MQVMPGVSLRPAGKMGRNSSANNKGTVTALVLSILVATFAIATSQYYINYMCWPTLICVCVSSIIQFNFDVLDIMTVMILCP